MSASDLSRVRSAPRLDRAAEPSPIAPPEPLGERSASSASRRGRALLVIGMHRSGTSAFTRVLNLVGARLPRHLMAASERNPLGYFESQRFYELHEKLLEEAGTSWDDLAPFPAQWFDSPAAPAWIDRMVDAFHAEFDGEPIVALKDPRIARLIPLWLRVLDRVGYEPAFVIPVRNPLDVAASLARAEGIHPSKSMLLWLEHLIAAERDTRGRRRSFVGYDALLDDWRRVIGRIANDLDVRFPRVSLRAAAEVDAFLAGELRHHAADPSEVLERQNVPAWVQRAYEWALDAAAGERVDAELLDELESALRPAGAAFGPVVAALEVAAEQSRASAERFEAKATRLASDVEQLTGDLRTTQREFEQTRVALAEREQQNAHMIDWLKLLLAWGMRSVHDGAGSEDHLAAVAEAADGADASVVPQVAALGIRLSQQAAELARVAEDADLHAAEARRATREVESLKGEIERREAERAELATARNELGTLRAELEEMQGALARQTQAAEKESQQVRGLWQQLAARDAETARLRRDVGELDVLREQVSELDALRRTAAQVGPLQAQVAELETLRTLLEDLEARRREEAAALDALRIQVESLRPLPAELERTAAALAELREESAAREASIAKLDAELRAAGLAVGERELYIEALRARTEDVERSRLWRAVRPFSKLARDLGAIFRG